MSGSPIIEASTCETNNYSCWVREKNQEFIPSLSTTSNLLPGKYKIVWNGMYNKYVFKRTEVKTDELLKFPNSTFDSILKDINFFWNNEDLFKKYKFNYKRGILLYGEPGCGKSSLINLLSQQVINRNGIIISIKNDVDLERYMSEVPSVFRVIQPNTPLLTVFEDLDALTLNSHTETELLNVLDGLEQMSNIVNIGCTNYPEKLKDRVLNRPSRFDKRYYIGLPNAETRRYYFFNKIDSDDLIKAGGEKFLNDIVSSTEGLSLAHLGELIKSIFIFQNSLDESLSIIKNMNEKLDSSKFNKKDIGF